MQNKIRVFIVDGVIDSAYTTDSSVNLEIVSYDKCKDSSEKLKKLYDECSSDDAMKHLDMNILHP